MCNMFRTLTAAEGECRVAQAGKKPGGAWASVLIYKDARVDQSILDEVIGPTNWKNDYAFIDGSLYCTVSIWDEGKREWVSKQNVGVESNTEAVKGEASDAFKRACFNWGIGRELYSAPKIFIDLKDGEWEERDGKVRCKAVFLVREIGYDDNRKVSRLVITDRKGDVRFSFGEKVPDRSRTPRAFTSGDGRQQLVEGGQAWVKFAERVARGEQCQDGTPIPVKMSEYYNIPPEAMRRFFDKVNEIRDRYMDQTQE